MQNKNDRIKGLREQLGISQKEFAARLGIAQGQISDMEKGKRRVTQTTIDLITLAYGVNIEWLESGQGEIFQQSPVSNEATSNDTDFKLLETILIAIDHYMETHNKVATPSEKAKLAVSFYKYFLTSKVAHNDLKAVTKQIESSIDIVSTMV
jgi:transcriptional regulator with XRE-family HTH domain